MSKPFSLKFDFVTDTTKLYSFTSIWITLAFFQSHKTFSMGNMDHLNFFLRIVLSVYEYFHVIRYFCFFHLYTVLSLFCTLVLEWCCHHWMLCRIWLTTKLSGMWFSCFLFYVVLFVLCMLCCKFDGIFHLCLPIWRFVSVVSILLMGLEEKVSSKMKCEEIVAGLMSNSRWE